MQMKGSSKTSKKKKIKKANQLWDAFGEENKLGQIEEKIIN